MRKRDRLRSGPRLGRPGIEVPSGILSVCFLVLLPATAPAVVLDFGAALQPLDAGEEVDTVTLENGAWMAVTCRNGGEGPDLCIVFDSADPTGGDVDLGTPNEDFGGPGKGQGGEDGEEGENAEALGKILIIAADDEDVDDDGRVDDPEDERDGGVLRFDFSHAGRLSFRVIDVDEDEEEPTVRLFKEGQSVGQVELEAWGDNSVQEVDLSSFGDVDAVEVEFEDSAAVADIRLDVMIVGTEPRTWSKMKRSFR